MFARDPRRGARCARRRGRRRCTRGRGRATRPRGVHALGELRAETVSRAEGGLFAAEVEVVVEGIGRGRDGEAEVPEFLVRVRRATHRAGLVTEHRGRVVVEVVVSRGERATDAEGSARGRRRVVGRGGTGRRRVGTLDRTPAESPLPRRARRRTRPGERVVRARERRNRTGGANRRQEPRRRRHRARRSARRGDRSSRRAVCGAQRAAGAIAASRISRRGLLRQLADYAGSPQRPPPRFARTVSLARAIASRRRNRTSARLPSSERQPPSSRRASTLGGGHAVLTFLPKRLASDRARR